MEDCIPSYHIALNQFLIVGNLLLSRFVLHISELMCIEKKKLDFFYFDDMFVLSSVFVLFSKFVLYLSELKCIEKKKLVFLFLSFFFYFDYNVCS